MVQVGGAQRRTVAGSACPGFSASAKWSRKVPEGSATVTGLLGS